MPQKIRGPRRCLRHGPRRSQKVHPRRCGRFDRFVFEHQCRHQGFRKRQSRNSSDLYLRRQPPIMREERFDATHHQLHAPGHVFQQAHPRGDSNMKRTRFKDPRTSTSTSFRLGGTAESVEKDDVEKLGPNHGRCKAKGKRQEGGSKEGRE